MMAKAKNGDTVKVHYTGTLDDGTVFDSSEGEDPIELTLGSPEIISGFQQTVVGMQPGESRTARIAAGDAYGDHQPERMFQVERDKLPPGMKAEVGQWLHGSLSNGDSISMRVAEVNDGMVLLDANHPLAGHDLNFNITLVAIV